MQALEWRFDWVKVRAVKWECENDASTVEAGCMQSTRMMPALLKLDDAVYRFGPNFDP